MDEGKKLFWKIDCPACEVSMRLEAVAQTIVDKGARFIRRPQFDCEKCKSTCIVTLIEEPIAPPQVPTEPAAPLTT